MTNLVVLWLKIEFGAKGKGGAQESKPLDNSKAVSEVYIEYNWTFTVKSA